MSIAELNDLEQAQIRGLEADTEYTNARSIEAQAMAERTRVDIMQNQANAIRTLVEIRGGAAFDPDLVVRAVTSNDLSLLIGGPTEPGSQVLIP